MRGAAGADSGLTHEGRIREARARVESIRKTLENYRDNPQESDFRTIGGAVRLDSRGIRHSGVRRVPTEEFAARIERAEAQLKAAEEELKSLERSLY